MFKSGLLVTTALVLVGSLSFFATRSVAVAEPANLGPGRDRNDPA